MNTELQNKVREILTHEFQPGGSLYEFLPKNESLADQVNAKLERVKELNNKSRAQEKERENLLEYMIDREIVLRREYQQKYQTTLLGLVDLVERFGGDSGAMMNWDSVEFVKNAKPEEVIENVYKSLKELEEDTEQRVAYSLADKLIKSAKSGKITPFDVMMESKKYYPQHNVTLLDNELIVAARS